jgi:hypothetical protein
MSDFSTGRACPGLEPKMYRSFKAREGVLIL